MVKYIATNVLGEIDMKKKIIVIAIVLILVALAILAIYFSKNKSLTDAVKFKNEYESLNSLKDSEGNTKYMPIEINSSNPIKYATINEVLNIIDNGTGVIYFGMPICPWCRNMINILIDSAKESGINTIYYYNPKEIRDQNTTEYQELVQKLKDYLNTDTATQKETDANFDASKKRVYMPDVFFIKNGKVLGHHLGTLDEQEDPKIPLTADQKQKLKEEFNSLMGKIKSDTCNDSSGVCE